MEKKTRIRIGIVVIITCVMCFSDCGFADDGNNFEIFAFSLDTILGYLAWIWVCFAKLAGIFLTNKLVYGEVLGWDVLLWKYWNLMKNIANFGLGFYFVYVIFGGLIKGGKEDIMKNFKNIIIWLLIAGIGIQSSWFFTAAIVDVSTITLSAAGAFPSQIISNDENVRTKMRDSLLNYVDVQGNVITGMIINFDDPSKNRGSLIDYKYVKLGDKQEFSHLIDEIMPRPDDVSGPLYFLGFNVLKTHLIPTKGSKDSNDLKKTIVNLIIYGGTTIVFTIEMLVLCVLALMRILYLWMFIIMSPIAILLWCIQKSGGKSPQGDKSFLSKFMKQINFKSFFINVFKPTIVVLCLGVSLIFISLMSEIIKSGGMSVDIKGSKITSVFDSDSKFKDTQKEGDKTYTTTIDNSFLHLTFAHAAKDFMGMILCIFTVIIVYFVVEIAMKMGDGEDFVSKKIGKVQDAVESALTTLPVVPVSGYDEKGDKAVHALSAGQVFGLGNKPSVFDSVMSKYQTNVNEEYRKQEEIVKSLIGSSTGYISSTEEREIVNRMGKRTWEGFKETRTYINSIKTEEGKGMTLDGSSDNSKLWVQQFKNWLENATNLSSAGGYWQNMQDAWKGMKDEEKNLENLFSRVDNSDKFRQAYAEFFGLANINNWEKLKSADISQK